MTNYEKINENIYRLTIPYKDIYTTVYIIKTSAGILLFDTASYDEDIPGYIEPFLNEIGVTGQNLKYIFISHNHKDHAGGLKALCQKYPEVCIISCCPKLKESYEGVYSFVSPGDNDTVLEVLKVVTIPGHTKDAAAIFDTRTKTLISGDCLQLYGIYGSGDWGANISLIPEHVCAVNKLKSMDIQTILTAHDYHPCGHIYRGKDEVSYALDCCIEPLKKIKELILNNPLLDDEQVCNIYNSTDNPPTLGKHVVSSVREAIKKDF